MVVNHCGVSQAGRIGQVVDAAGESVTGGCCCRVLHRLVERAASRHAGSGVGVSVRDTGNRSGIRAANLRLDRAEGHAGVATYTGRIHFATGRTGMRTVSRGVTAQHRVLRVVDATTERVA